MTGKTQAPDPATGELLPATDARTLLELRDADVVERAQLLMENTGGKLDVRLLPRVALPGGLSTTWIFDNGVTGPAEVKELELIALHGGRARAFWPEAMGTGDPLPACSSGDGITGHGDPGGRCADCQWSQFCRACRSACCGSRRPACGRGTPTRWPSPAPACRSTKR